jgi:hypothetical protein
MQTTTSCPTERAVSHKLFKYKIKRTSLPHKKKKKPTQIGMPNPISRGMNSSQRHKKVNAFNGCYFNSIYRGANNVMVMRVRVVVIFKLIFI